MKKEELRVAWRERIEAYKASGQTQIAFCSKHGLHIKQFNYWLRKHRSENRATDRNASGWVTLDVKEHTDCLQDNSLKIRLGQATVEVKPGIDQKLLLDVLKTLRAIC